eukprot:741505_1
MSLENPPQLSEPTEHGATARTSGESRPSSPKRTRAGALSYACGDTSPDTSLGPSDSLPGTPTRGTSESETGESSGRLPRGSHILKSPESMDAPFEMTHEQPLQRSQSDISIAIPHRRSQARRSQNIRNASMNLRTFSSRASRPLKSPRSPRRESTDKPVLHTRVSGPKSEPIRLSQYKRKVSQRFSDLSTNVIDFLESPRPSGQSRGLLQEIENKRSLTGSQADRSRLSQYKKKVSTHFTQLSSSMLQYIQSPRGSPEHSLSNSQTQLEVN